jgi:phosphoribosylformylglycinamidine synthase subunit PurL
LNPEEPEVDEKLAVAHGLEPDEYARLVALIGRTPTFTELGIVSAMWNEDCSYKSSRLHEGALRQVEMLAEAKP